MDRQFRWAQITGILAFFVATTAMFISGGETAALPWINHDSANALYIGGELTRGDVLYVDWYYFVFPPIVFWSAGVYFVAELLGLSPATVFHCVFVATTGLGAAVLQRAFPRPSPQSLLVGLAYLSLLIFPGVRSADLGQREHLFVLLLVPYLAWRLSEHPPSALVFGLLASLGFAMMIKPHFLAVVALSELLLIRKTHHRTAVWAALSIGAILPFATLAIHSREAVRGFFERAIPYHLSGSYAHYGQTFERFAATPLPYILLAMLVLLTVSVFAAQRRGALERWKALAAVALSVALFGSFLQQWKFYHYHALPFYGVTLTLTALGVGHLLSAIEASGLRRKTTGLAALVLLLLIGSGFRNVHELLHSQPRSRNVELFALLEDQHRAMLMTPIVEADLFRYLLSHDFKIIGPWSSNYTVAGLLAIEDPRERRAALSGYFETLAAELDRQKPDLVLFSPIAYPRGTPPLHTVVVNQRAAFPTPDYEFWRRTRQGWDLYRRVNPRADR